MDALLDELSPSQLDELMALYALDPWGELRVDAAAARLTAAWVGGSPADHMPQLDELGTDEDISAEAAAREVAAIRRMADRQEL